MTAAAGHETRVNYLWEDNGFAASPTDTTHKVPGADTQLTTAEGRRNLRQLFRPGSRVPIDTLAMHFDGAFALQFTLTNPWWLRGFLGTPTTTGNDPDGDTVTDSWTHTYNGTSPESMRIIETHEEADSERFLKGCVPTRLTVQCAVEDVVQVTVEGAYAEEETDTSAGGLTAQTTISDDALTFVDAGLSIGGTTEGYVQDMTFTLEATADMIREMGSAFPIDFNEKTLVPSFDFRAIRHGDDSNLAEMYGSSFTAGVNTQDERMENKVKLDVDFDNGEADGSGVNKLLFDITGTLTDTYNQSGIGDPTADLEETINRFAEGVTAKATNETSAAP